MLALENAESQGEEVTLTLWRGRPVMVVPPKKHFQKQSRKHKKRKREEQCSAARESSHGAWKGSLDTFLRTLGLL